MFTQVLPFEFDIIYISEREKKKKNLNQLDQCIENVFQIYWCKLEKL